MIYLIIPIILMVLVIVVLPKKAVYILTAVLVLVLAVALVVYWQDEQEQEELQRVVVDIGIDKRVCEPDKPVLYNITNDAERTVYRVVFNYAIYRQGYSRAIAEPYGEDVTSHKILAPGERFRACIELPALKEAVAYKEMQFQLQQKRVWFKPPIH